MLEQDPGRRDREYQGPTSKVHLLKWYVLWRRRRVTKISLEVERKANEGMSLDVLWVLVEREVRSPRSWEARERVEEGLGWRTLGR